MHAYHFIFSIESVGMTSPAVLVAEALRVLQQKCQRLSDLADQSGMAADEAEGVDETEMKE